VLGAGPAGPEAALAAAFTPALADFDALLRLRRAALPAADRALLPAAAAAAAALRCRFVEAGGCGAAADAAPGSRAQAMLHAIPAGAPAPGGAPASACTSAICRLVPCHGCERRRLPARLALRTSALKAPAQAWRRGAARRDWRRSCWWAPTRWPRWRPRCRRALAAWRCCAPMRWVARCWASSGGRRRAPRVPEPASRPRSAAAGSACRRFPLTRDLHSWARLDITSCSFHTCSHVQTVPCQTSRAEACIAEQARAPHPLDARTAHAMRPAGDSPGQPAAAGAKRRRAEAGADGADPGAVTQVVLDETAVLADMAAMGAGLVEGVLVKAHARTDQA